MEFGFLTGDNGFYSYFAEKDMADVKASDTVVLSLQVKAVRQCTRADITVNGADGKDISMTYYVPVQWTRINMPVIGAVASVRVDAAKNAILIGSGTVTNHKNTKLSDPALRGGMWMVDRFDTFVLDETEAVGTGSIDIVKNGNYTYTIGSNGVLTITDVTHRN